MRTATGRCAIKLGYRSRTHEWTALAPARATDTAVPTQEADVYALGASWFISATGWRHVSYPDDADRKDQRQAIVGKPHRPINVPGPLRPLMEGMMSRDPLLRPTSTDVCAALHGML
ncbi:hypothetical protein AB0F24_03475 [Streptomyces platensis]|uniref:hypothetical protein n=1 Tax=Streptomyces platensis TaxID=58346 RepID=UPI0033CC923D